MGRFKPALSFIEKEGKNMTTEQNIEQVPSAQPATEQDYEKLKELMEFPAAMTFKVAGINRENLAQDLIAVVQKYIPGDYIPKEKRSSKGTYNSVSIDVVAQNFEQVETLYKELAKVEGVKMVI